MDTVTINALSSIPAAQPARQVVFIENNLYDWGLLSRQMAANAEVIVLDSAQDGLAQMASYLATLQPGSLDAIHVLSHGAAGQLNLGSITLTQDSLSQYSAELNAIGQALGEDGDLLLYGCDVGAGEAGETLVRQLAAITRADVAASSNLTGASALGGDWVLETHSGAVNSAALTLDEYMGTLALTVTNSFATGVGTPEDLAIDSQNNLYVVSIDDNTLYKYAASGGAITGGAVNTAFATITNATCVAIDTAGNLYLGTGSGIIMKYPASGGVPSNVGGVSFASGFNNISDIVVGSDGYLYAADSGASKVYKLPASGGPLTLASVLASATVNGAQQLYIDAANNLYATSPSDGKVIKFAASGGAISLASPSDFVTGLSDEPRSITSDGTNFYIGTGSFGGDGKVYKTGAGGGAVTPENTFTGAQVTELLWAGSNTLYGTFSDNMVRKLVTPAPNTAPTITSGAGGSVGENSSTSVVVYTATATDAESNPISYSLSGADAGQLTIDSSTGVVRLVSAANYEVKNAYNINIVASDGAASSTKAVTISVTDVNENPVFSGAASGSVAENAPTSTVVYTATATDPEGATVNYKLSGTDAASFNIDSTTGAITLKASADYETKSSYSLNLLAVDGVNTGLKVITVAVTNVNEKPAITAPASQSVNQATATALTGISVTDPDSGSNMLTLSFSAPAGTFAATSGSGVTALGSGTSSMTLTGTQTNINAFITASKVTYTTAAGATGTVTLSIGSNDGGNSGSGGTQTDSATETLNIAVANAAPTITSGASGSVAENAATSTVVYTTTATDPESDALTYALTGTDAASFTIDTAGAVRLVSPADFETKSSYSITVNAKDASNTTTKAVTINVTDVNEAPNITSGATGSVAENAATSTVVYTAAASDPESGAVSYSLSGTDAASFSINSSTGAVTLNASADYETKSSYNLTLIAADASSNTSGKAVTINVTNVNEKPVLTAPASQNVMQATATALTGISVADPDSGSNPITVSLSAPAGTFTSTTGSGVTVLGSGTSSMTLTGTQSNINAFITASKVTYTTAAGATGTVTLSIGSNDGGNSGSGGTQTDSKTETLNVVPPNAAPVISSGASGSVAENAATSTVVYTATATDAESDTIAYALSGTDAASFSINSSTGAVTLNASADFETKSSYSITVNAKDASNTTTKAVTINVTDVNEAPTNIALSASSVAENTSTASALNIGNLTSTDPDTGNTFTYSVVGGADQASFQVTGAALQFKAGTTLDYETKNSYAVTVRSTDQGGLTFDKAFTVTLTDANDKPVITVPASQNITIGSAAALSGISVADQDAGSNSISLALSVPAGTLTATSGGGVTVSGSGSGSLTLAGSQSAINTFLSGGGVSYATAVGASAGSTVTLSLVANDNGFSGGGAQTGNGSVTLNLAAAGGGGGGGGSGSSSSSTLVDGVNVTSGTVTRSDGSSVPSKIIPVVTAGRQDQDGASANADIPLAGSNTTPAIKAEIPVGIGMTSIGGDSTKTDKTDLITAIKSRTVDKSADQNSMVDLGNFFLKTLPNSADLWVRTVVISADSSKDAAGSLVFRGQTSDSNTDTALVLDFSNLPKNSKVSTENIHFAAVVGEVTITTGDGNQLLIADNKAQTLDLGAGNDTVYSGAGNDVLNNSKGNDKLFGQGGNDTFNAENGQNTLHGGADSDTAKFTGKRADYTVERHDGYVKVINNADTSKSTLVVNTETLQFADSSETLQARDELKVLAGSYLQVLGRQADVYGFDYFGDLQSKGYSLGGIAINMIKSDEAKARGFVLTGDAVNDVEMLYKAILGRESDAGGKAAWVQQMQANGMTLEQVANAFMVSGEMQKQYLVQTGWDFLV